MEKSKGTIGLTKSDYVGGVKDIGTGKIIKVTGNVKAEKDIGQGIYSLAYSKNVQVATIKKGGGLINNINIKPVHNKPFTEIESVGVIIPPKSNNIFGYVGSSDKVLGKVMTSEQLATSNLRLSPNVFGAIKVGGNIKPISSSGSITSVTLSTPTKLATQQANILAFKGYGDITKQLIKDTRGSTTFRLIPTLSTKVSTSPRQIQTIFIPYNSKVVESPRLDTGNKLVTASKVNLLLRNESLQINKTILEVKTIEKQKTRHLRSARSKN
jgi:hypothetical protein